MAEWHAHNDQIQQVHIYHPPAEAARGSLLRGKEEKDEEGVTEDRCYPVVVAVGLVLLLVLSSLLTTSFLICLMTAVAL